MFFLSNLLAGSQISGILFRLKRTFMFRPVQRLFLSRIRFVWREFAVQMRFYVLSADPRQARILNPGDCMLITITFNLKRTLLIQCHSAL